MTFFTYRRRGWAAGAILALATLLGCVKSIDSQTATGSVATASSWQLVDFTKQDAVNPIMGPSATGVFTDPILNQPIHWEEKDVFNPAVVVKDGKMYMLYRAENLLTGPVGKTSRIGLAVSTDGLHFTRQLAPVLYPDNDAQKQYEWPGGTEDPRVVESDDHTYYMTYTAYDGTLARLQVASSPDLVHWT